MAETASMLTLAGGGRPCPVCQALYQPGPPVLACLLTPPLLAIPQALCVLRVDPPSRRRPLDHVGQGRARQRLRPPERGSRRYRPFSSPLQHPCRCVRGARVGGQRGGRKSHRALLSWEAFSGEMTLLIMIHVLTHSVSPSPQVSDAPRRGVLFRHRLTLPFEDPDFLPRLFLMAAVS